MSVNEIFVPATLVGLRTIDPGEIRTVAFALPREYSVNGKSYPLQDQMRPGNAFLAKPFGARTAKVRRRMYTRSNSSVDSKLTLETIINHTHAAKADTSIWWQSKEVEALQREGGTVDIRVAWSQDRTHLLVYENSLDCKPANLRLEPDDQWPHMRFLAIALSTGITPFLAHVRYMATFNFGRTANHPGCRYTLVASHRNHRQLMEHEELLALERQFPDHFRYFPVLTREWPAGWPYGKGRIVRVKEGTDDDPQIDVGPLLEIIPDAEQCHVRMCGNTVARNQLLKGLEQNGIEPPSFRSEVW